MFKSTSVSLLAGSTIRDSLQALFCGNWRFSAGCRERVVDGCRGKLVNVVSGVPWGSVFGPLLFLLYTAELFAIVENKLCDYADDSTLVAVVTSPGERAAVSESMNLHLNRVSVWCNLWGMKLNASKTKTMIVSRSRTAHSQLTPWTLDGTVLKESADLVILGVTFDAKMTFEQHLRSVSSAAAQRLGIMKKVLAGIT